MKQAAHIKEVREPGDVPALSALGFPAMPLQWIENMSRPEGLRFLSGTTGSGGRGARATLCPRPTWCSAMAVSWEERMKLSADVRVPADIAEWVFVEPVESDAGVRLFVDTHHRGDARVQSWVTSVKGQHPVRDIAFVSLSELVKLRDVARQASQSAVGLTADDLRDVSANQEQVLRLFSLAAELGSSDIHMTIAGYTRIEMRINGDLQVIKDIPREDGYALASTIILSMCDVTEKQFFPNRKQDGRVKAEFLRKVNLFGARYSHTPTVDGLYLVMRTIADDGDDVPHCRRWGICRRNVTWLTISCVARKAWSSCRGLRVRANPPRCGC